MVESRLSSTRGICKGKHCKPNLQLKLEHALFCHLVSKQQVMPHAKPMVVVGPFLNIQHVGQLTNL